MLTSLHGVISNSSTPKQQQLLLVGDASIWLAVQAVMLTRLKCRQSEVAQHCPTLKTQSFARPVTLCQVATRGTGPCPARHHKKQDGGTLHTHVYESQQN